MPEDGAITMRIYALPLLLLLFLCQGCSHGPDLASETTAAKEEIVVLTISQFKIEIIEKVNKMAQDYMKSHPNIRLDIKVGTSYNLERNKEFAADDAPDLFFVRGFDEMEDWSRLLADLSAEPWMAQVSEQARPGMTVAGKQYGFPVSYEGIGMIYNKDLFEQAGIDKIPETLSELRDVNERLRAAGISSFYEAHQNEARLGQHFFGLPFSLLGDEAPAFVKGLNTGAVQLDDNRFMNGFFEVLDMTLVYGEGGDSLGIEYNTLIENFSNGRSAMMIDGNWVAEWVHRMNGGLRLGMFAIPLSEDPEDTRLPVDVSAYFVINNRSEHIEEAKAFLRWLHDNGQTYLVESWNFIPAFEDLEVDSKRHPLADTIETYMATGKTTNWGFLLWPNNFGNFATSLQTYIAGQATREETMREIEEKWTTIYRLLKDTP
jgi:raffinose/stachyose/melibiose transport system substrate-binding protein